jgi:hypothetical protein
MVKKAVQRGRSKRRGEAYAFRYLEPLNAARTKLADFFNILLRHSTYDRWGRCWGGVDLMVPAIFLGLPRLAARDGATSSSNARSGSATDQT